MRRILEFEEYKYKKIESKTRTKPLTDEQFIEIFKENCEYFSFDNDLLWRRSNKSFGEFGLFIPTERARTIGKLNYKNYFDLRSNYIVKRQNSLIGSTSANATTLLGSELHGDVFLVIPFDESNIVFAGTPDLAYWADEGGFEENMYSDDMFVLTKYKENFKIPTDKLVNILDRTLPKYSKTIQNKDMGFEFFTSSNCLLLHKDRIDWLKENLNRG